MAAILVLKRNREIVKINENALKLFRIKNPNSLVRRKIRFLKFDILADIVEDFMEASEDTWMKMIPNPGEVLDEKPNPSPIQCEMMKLSRVKKQVDFILLVLKA
jgi:hypothetical protein